MGIIPLTHPNKELYSIGIIALLHLTIPTALCDDPILLCELLDLKAISQNVMHSCVTITDSIYGNLVGNDVHEAIAHLGQGRPDDLQSKIDELLELLKEV